jgi:hypothetical protein
MVLLEQLMEVVVVDLVDLLEYLLVETLVVVEQDVLEVLLRTILVVMVLLVQ